MTASCPDRVPFLFQYHMGLDIQFWLLFLTMHKIKWCKFFTRSCVPASCNVLCLFPPVGSRKECLTHNLVLQKSSPEVKILPGASLWTLSEILVAMSLWHHYLLFACVNFSCAKCSSPKLNSVVLDVRYRLT